MKALILAALLVAAPTFAQVPGEDEIAYITSNKGEIIYVPESHTVIMQPKGFNTAPFSYPDNMAGVYKNRWPLLDAICKHLENQFSTGETVPYPPAVCYEDNRVKR